MEQGYFKKEGIVPKITWTPSGREFAEAFAARAVVMGTSGEQPAINLAHRGLPVRVFAQLCEMSDSLGAVGQFAVILFLVYFFLVTGDLYKRKIVKIAGPHFWQKKLTVQILDDINLQIASFMRVQLLTSVDI